MKPRLLLMLLLLLLPSLCLAELTPYQKNVVAGFATAGTEKPLVAAYEAVASGSATPAQRQLIRTSEMVYEDIKLGDCVQRVLGAGITIEAAAAKLVAAGQGDALVADARPLFAQGEWEGMVTEGAPLLERATAVAVLLATGSETHEGEGANPQRALQRHMILNYYLAFATDGKCRASPQIKAMLGKASK